MWVLRCPVSNLSLETNMARKHNAFFLMDYTSLLGLIIDGKGNTSVGKHSGYVLDSEVSVVQMKPCVEC